MRSILRQKYGNGLEKHSSLGLIFWNNFAQVNLIQGQNDQQHEAGLAVASRHASDTSYCHALQDPLNKRQRARVCVYTIARQHLYGPMAHYATWSPAKQVG